MGKFKVKPTRAVAKPFKNILMGAFSFNNDSKASSTSTTNQPQHPASILGPKRKRERDGNDDDANNAIKDSSEDMMTMDFDTSHSLKKMKKSGLLTGSGGGGGSISKWKNKRKSQQRKKAVTFSKNLTEVGKKTGKDAGSIIDEIIQSHSAHLRTISPGMPPGILKGHGSLATASASSAEGTQMKGKGPLKKVLRTEIKDKKSRIKARKEIFKKKIELIKAHQEEVKAAKQRQKTVIIGDMKPMSSILDELHEEVKSKGKETSNSTEKGPQRAKKKKFSVVQRQKELLDGLAFFKKAGL